MFETLIWQFIKWHKLLVDPLSKRLFDEPLPPPTVREQELIAELRAELAPERRPASLPKWDEFRKQFRAACELGDPRSFLRWAMLQRSMCLTNSGALIPEYLALRNGGRWEHFAPAIVESPVGNPVRFLYYPSSSGCLLHHCHHVMAFEKATGSNLAASEVIVEFGAGYGSMCRLLHRLGFSGRYFIYDLPEFVALQRYFLGSLDLPLHNDSSGSCDSGIYHFTDLDALRKAIDALPSGAARTFIATWSLSESQMDLRDEFLPLVRDFDHYLIAFQNLFCGENNRAYFAEFERATRERIAWTGKRLWHLPGNNYLFGTKRNANGS